MAQADILRLRHARAALCAGAAQDRTAVRRLAPLDRYERRAVRQRNGAIRGFDEARLSAVAASEQGAAAATCAGTPINETNSPAAPQQSIRTPLGATSAAGPAA